MIRRLRTKIHYWLKADKYEELIAKCTRDLRSPDPEVAIKAAEFLMSVLPLLHKASPFKAHYTEIVCTAYNGLLNPDKMVRFKMADLLEVMILIDMRPTTELLLLFADEAQTRQLSGILTVLCKVLGKDGSDGSMKEFPNREVLSLFERHLYSGDDIIRGKALAGAQLMDYYFKASIANDHSWGR